MKIAVLYHAVQVDESIVSSIVEKINGSGNSAEVFLSADRVSGDRLLVLGGDGTVLHAAQKAAENDIPIVAVNYGTRGFLTEFNRGETEQAVDFILSDRHSVLRRSMIEVVFNGTCRHCLNEIVLSRHVAPQNAGKVVRFSVSVNGNEAGIFAADGMILATPTGSTAYSLSAGGSILAPDCNAFIVTPVCACASECRPVVCPDSDEFFFSTVEGAELALYGDGDFLGIIGENDVLHVRKSPRSATFLLRNQGEFFRRLNNKIIG